MKNKMKESKQSKLYFQKLLATTIAALSSGMVITSVVQASDIDIYQEAKSGEITLMLLLDLSGSMNRNASGGGSACDIPSGVSASTVRTSTTEVYISGVAAYERRWCQNGSSNSAARYYDRITRLKDGLIDLLYGNTSKNIVRLTDDKVIGLSTFQGNDGYIRIPARPLGEVVGGKTQRQILIDEVRGLVADSTTPTFRAFTDVASYMMGTNTQRRAQRNNSVYYFSYNNSGIKYRTCTAWNTSGACTTFAAQATANPVPSGSNFQQVACSYRFNTTNAQSPLSSGGTLYNGTCYRSDWSISTATSNSGYPKSYNETKVVEEFRYRAPESLTQTEDIKKCSGQGIYVLTDGEPTDSQAPQDLMRNALNDQGFSCSSSWGAGSDWNCAYTFNNNLLLNNSSNNPLALKIKTAIVGFGSSFNNVESFDKSKTQAQNIAALGTINTNVKKAAYWGIIGEGGWYSGNSSEDIVNSVNSFLGDLGTVIPAVTTGSPTVPKDRLNPAVLQKQAYFPQFQPTPDKTYQLWAGNLKKYNVVAGILKDQASNNIVDSQGRIVDNYDLWSPAVSTNPAIKDADEDIYGSTKFALKGGAWSQLKLKMDTGATVDNRKLLTNRIANGTGVAATFVTGTSLRRISSTDLVDTTYKNDANRGYLMQLLGYNVNPSNPTITAATPELRQVGAVMHSSPLLVTNKGKIVYKNGELKTENREDYVLFGTTQGLLHVVDAETGQEKFAFVPNEMIEGQKEAFQKYDTTSGGLSNLYYGIDGPWTTYTEYVIDGSGNLTVGTGKGIAQKGKQLAYGGLRMGGRSYYALDFQNINNPELLFHISPDDRKVYSRDGSITTYNELGDMGQSWSKPAITWVKWNKQRKRVMFVGGGYDAGGPDGKANTGGYENDTYNQINRRGGGVYMFDADNGKLLWWAGANTTAASSNVVKTAASDLKYSVVSEIRTEDRDGDGLADHLYFGDLGGQLFRIDLDNNAVSTKDFAKTPRRLLNLNAAEKSPRFYEMPSFSVYDYAGQTFAVVSIGSGNRSLPLKDYTVGTSGYDYDAVYNIYDRDVAARNLYKSGYTFVTPTLTKSDLGEITQNNRNDDTTLVAPYPMSSTAKQGWYYRFQSNKLQSAKVFSTPIALNNRLFVSTFDGSKPGLSGDCGAGVKGESFLNQFCLPYGQCDKKLATDSGLSCSTGDGCSLGAGIQYTAIVDDGNECDPADPTCKPNGGGGPKPEDGSNNKNYCLSTGNRGATMVGGIISTGSSRICLEPQRWYERSR
ncbi:PilC/PilY family type IV pilus protein [Acinetobacter sp. NIPH 2699]|uniref:pilus assembly protein n=1 Tax=Acinetobacter sp. NIPH 2699 TaxID=2923433 RepID=UPI001F4A3B6B|nr:PilC/PilY family type IV pilus protein [Acinetobacter sp. NIPH 2699]MCH7335852.1 pilus assembly protein PilY [Acinetobacter sp. NIPH 2699]